VVENELRRRIGLGTPLSRVLIPLTLGLTRRALLRSGVTSETRRLAGILTHFYCRSGRPGSDPELPVVLIHGIADSALTWAFVLRGIAGVGPVYALDLPGFGQSGHPPGRPYATIAEQTAVVAAFLREVVGRPAILVGNSMGGWIAARLALEAPELARGIVLLDPGGALLEGRASWDPFVTAVAVPDLRSVRAIYRQMFGRVPLPLYLAQHSFQDMFLRRSVREFIKASVSAADNEDIVAAGFFAPTDLRRITVPAALVWGDRDTFLPKGSFEFFRDNLPGAQTYVLRDCGHLPQREEPRRVVQIVRAFAERVHRVGPARREGVRA
jgi:pimeloyl-ACP methyl ester carboxylesterase